MKKLLALALALVFCLSVMGIATAEKAGEGLTIGIRWFEPVRLSGPQ